MKSSDWLILPIYRNAFPTRIYEIAKKVGVEPESIAENENVQVGRTLLKPIPYDQLQTIIDVEEFDESDTQTFVMFADESAIIVDYPVTKFIKILDKFMENSPKYRKFNSNNTSTIVYQYDVGNNNGTDSDD